MKTAKTGSECNGCAQLRHQVGGIWVCGVTDMCREELLLGADAVDSISAGITVGQVKGKILKITQLGIGRCTGMILADEKVKGRLAQGDGLQFRKIPAEIVGAQHKIELPLGNPINQIIEGVRLPKPDLGTGFL